MLIFILSRLLCCLVSRGNPPVCVRRVGSNPPEMGSPAVEDSMTASGYGHSHSHPVVGRSGQILWIRGLTRLQTQVGDSAFPPLASLLYIFNSRTSGHTARGKEI
jgi:hypothetical protein